MRRLPAIRTLALTGLLGLVCLAACSNSGDDGSTGGAAADTGGFTVPDNGPRFGGSDTLGGEADAAGGASDVTQTVGDAGNTGDQPCVEDGLWGCGCVGNDDCDSGYCVDTPDGRQCSKTCVEDCPGGWLCVGVTGSSGDLSYVCVPPHVTLCRPCEKDGDCQQLGAEIGTHRCLPLTADEGSLVGSFCGHDCSGGQPCPDGYSCAEVEVAGSTIKQCRPDNNTCSCSKQATAGGFSTTCNIKNEHGTCGGSRACTDAGLSACSATVPGIEVCNGKDDDCDGETDEGFIYNDFGVTKTVGKPCGAGACAGGEVMCASDGKSTVCSTGGGAVEKCDGADNDCDGQTDEAADLDQTAAKCADKGVCADGGVTAACVKGAWQCNYAAVKLYEGATEISCDGKDNDCDGGTDEDFAVAAGGKLLPVGSPCGGVGLCKKGVVECKDGQVGIAVCSTGPGGSYDQSKIERCNDLDDDCDGDVDEGCDNDGDNYCSVDMKLEGNPKICGDGGGDCDDNNKFVHPKAVEQCDDIDNDCSGVTDDGCDDDGDGHCSTGKTIVGNPKICSKLGFDCNDKDKAIHPGAKELCDTIDNDCNGQTDAQDFKLQEFAPKCANQIGVCKGSMRPISLCKNGKWLACDDATYFQHHGAFEQAAAESSCDNADNNCDGTTDEGCDDDGDGYCDKSKDTKGHPKVCIEGGGDCDDKDKDVHPDATELCNGKDDDCDKLPDSADPKLVLAAPMCERQKGVCAAAAKPVSLCKAGKWAPCTDKEYAQNAPNYETGVNEQTCDDADNNCDGVTDEACDGDGDSYCSDLKKVVGNPKVCPLGGLDCDDKEKAVNPGAKEVCDAAFVDENCNSKVGEPGALKCTNYYYDGDSDGYGAKGANPLCLCQPDANQKLTALKPDDCNDANFNIHPGAKESCATGGDDNCNGVAQEEGAAACKIYWYDPDLDGFGSVTQPPKCLCYPDAPSKYTATKPGDCDDGQGGIGPDKTETCVTLFDDNCNGTNNDVNAIGCTKYYVDSDKDGFGKAGSSPICLCSPIPASNYTATEATDCNDGNKAVKPGAKDTCATPGVDDNCDGKVDPDGSVGCKSYYYDGDGDGFGIGAPRCLCAPEPGSFFTATKLTDCDDSSKTRYPGALELCNDIDDDCDKKADNGADKTCKTAANSNQVCSAGKCKLGQCSKWWHDVDGSYTNGCECLSDAETRAGQGATCASAQSVLEVNDGGVLRYVTGNVMPGEAGDWYKVYARDLADTGSSACDTFNFRAWLNVNPGGQYLIDLYRGTCAAAGLHCTDQTDAGWTTHYYGYPYGPHALAGTKQGLHKPSPVPLRAGECKCTSSNSNGASGPGLSGMNMCTNNSAYFYIRVHRKAGVKATCSSYQLGISNGK